MSTSEKTTTVTETDEKRESSSSDATTKACSKGKDDNQLKAPDENDVKMSRGPRPEMNLDFEKLRPMVVYSETGGEVRLLDLFANFKTILIFTRHFLDFITKEYVEDLALIPPKHLQEARVRLVIIAPSPHKFISAFRRLTKYPYHIFVDPDREVFKAFGLVEKAAYGELKNSRHVKSGLLGGFFKSLWRAMESKEYQGNTKQQGGSFILGPGEQLHFHHQDTASADHMNINDLLMEAGVQAVSFPRDQRVITI